MLQRSNVGIGRKLYGFWKISCFKNQLCNILYPKKPGMHWLGCNDAVPWLNEAKTRIFEPTADFEINLYFICLPACLP